MDLPSEPSLPLSADLSTMAFSATLSDDSTAKTKSVSKQCDIFFPSTRSSCHSSTCRTPSFSSSSSLSPCSSSLDSSYFLDDSALSPATPLRFSGVPFSWEHLPGIPKKPSNISKNINSLEHLPLPPPTATHVSRRLWLNREETGVGTGGNKKKSTASKQANQRDPFFDAYVECSKDDDAEETSSQDSFSNESSKVLRSLGDRFGFVGLYASCKRTCAVAESIVVHRPSSFRSSNSYELINHPSRRLD